MAAVTNCHELRGWNTMNSYPRVREMGSLTWVSGFKSRCQKDSVPSWMLPEDLFFCLFPLPEAAFTPWLGAPVYPWDQRGPAGSRSHPAALTPTLLPSSAAPEDLGSHTGSTWIIPNNLSTLKSVDANLIASATLIPICHVISHIQRLQGLGQGCFLWAIIILPTTNLKLSPMPVQVQM